MSKSIQVVIDEYVLAKGSDLDAQLLLVGATIYGDILCTLYANV